MSEDGKLRFDLLGTGGSDTPVQPTLNIEDNEKLLIKKALLTNRGNVTRAASDLGIDRNALYRRMKKYGIQ
jgi:transcriptional regulator of acetoin/glycerol metabolism